MRRRRGRNVDSPWRRGEAAASGYSVEAIGPADRAVAARSRRRCVVRVRSLRRRVGCAWSGGAAALLDRCMGRPRVRATPASSSRRPRHIHVAPAASPRLDSTEPPRGRTRVASRRFIQAEIEKVDAQTKAKQEEMQKIGETIMEKQKALRNQAADEARKVYEEQMAKMEQ